MPYLPDGTCFDGIPAKQKPQDGYPADPENLVECHVCKGHGSWVLQKDAYGKGSHFKAGCNQCNGWGWVVKGSKDDTCPKHEWDEQNIAMCLHRWTCKLCGEKRTVDSSG